MASISSSTRCCASCSHYTGYVQADAFGHFIQVMPGSHGTCAGGGYPGASMPAMGSCPKWSHRF